MWWVETTTARCWWFRCCSCNTDADDRECSRRPAQAAQGIWRWLRKSWTNQSTRLTRDAQQNRTRLLAECSTGRGLFSEDSQGQQRRKPSQRCWTGRCRSCSETQISARWRLRCEFRFAASTPARSSKSHRLDYAEAPNSERFHCWWWCETLLLVQELSMKKKRRSFN